MVQSLTTVEQGAHGEDEEVKNEVAQDKAFTMIQQFREVKARAKGNERQEHVVTVVRVSTTAETARTTEE